MLELCNGFYQIIELEINHQIPLHSFHTILSDVTASILMTLSVLGKGRLIETVRSYIKILKVVFDLLAEIVKWVREGGGRGSRG